MSEDYQRLEKMYEQARTDYFAVSREHEQLKKEHAALLHRATAFEALLLQLGTTLAAQKK